MATLEKEDFWGCELKKGSTEVKFNPEFEDSELSEVEHKLILSQACLGAKASGRCLVQVTSRDYKGEENKHVIVSLQSGSTEMCPLNLSFSPPTTFKLVEGSGPVHLTGNHVQSLTEDDLESSEESDEDEDPVPLLVDSKEATKNKRPLPSSTPSGPPKKKTKVNIDEEEEDEEDEEDELSDEEEEPSKPVPSKKDNKQESKRPVKAAKKDEEESEEESEDDDDDEDDDEDDEDEEEDEVGSDDEEESEEESDDDEEEEDSDDEESDEVTKTLTAGKKDSAQKPMTNGVASKKGDKKTPAKPQQKTPPKKTPQQKTPQQKTPSEKPKDIDSIKQALLKSPALPKKVDKFKNFMRSSYKITDDKTVKDVWDFIQKNKK